jgi:hypothetical protein
MRRSIGITVLALGTVLGYGSAIYGMRYHRCHRDAFERHVADVCVDAANRAQSGQPAPKAPPPTPE